jgi:uncharacterized membrane protein YhaH (DUF805 family)
VDGAAENHPFPAIRFRAITMQATSDRRAYLWIAFLVAALTAIALFFIPAFIIRPFTHQSARGMALAMALRQRAPWGTLIAALICFVLLLVLWSAVNVWRKVALAFVMVLVTFSTVMARLNYFEWMFHPVDSAQFESASASKLDKSEAILTVRYGSDARAYPIREMAYHHVLNDVVGGVPVAVTY